jgi:hypothetical protein
MAEQRIVVKVDRLHPITAWSVAFTQAVAGVFGRTGGWAAAIAQHCASVVAILMGPAVLSVYAFAVWSLTADMGWTDSFPFSGGPLSNWIIWTGMAISIHIASIILRKQKERS